MSYDFLPAFPPPPNALAVVGLLRDAGNGKSLHVVLLFKVMFGLWGWCQEAYLQGRDPFVHSLVCGGEASS